MEEENPGVTCSVCLLDAERSGVMDVIAPGLPAAFRQEIIGVKMGAPFQAPCAETVATGCAVLVADVEADERWANTRWGERVCHYGQRQCRTTPIFDAARRVCATFVLFSPGRDNPALADDDRNETAASLASIAINRARDEAELRRKEERLRLAVAAAGLGLWDWDAVRNSGSQDERCREIFRAQSLDYAGWRERVHPEDRARAEATFLGALAGEGDGNFVNEYRIVLPDGEVRWVRGHGTVIFDEVDGRRQAVRVIGANLDVTEQRRDAESAARAAERFRFLAESLPHKIFTTDAAGETDYFNGQWATYTGLPVEEVLRRGWRDFVHPEDRPEKEARWKEAMEARRRFEFEHRLRRADGVYRWHLTRVEPLTRADGGVVMWVGSNTDVHDLKQAQLDLEVREGRFRVMADATPVLVWMADASAECTYFNRSWLEYTGRTLEEESGSGWMDGVHPEDLARCRATYLAAFERRESFHMEYRLRRHDGGYRWIIDRGEPLRALDGTFIGYIGGCVEIHEQKELEHRLREAEERARLAVEAAGMGFWDWKIGAVVKWSPEHNRILGIDLERTEGTYEEFLDRVLPEDRARVARDLAGALAGRNDLSMEFRARDGSGAVRWVAGHGRAFYDERTGEPHRMIGVVLDITASKDAEAQLLRKQEELRAALAAAELARDEAEAASRTKDHFLAVLSHELRTPLTPVLMAVSMLSRDPETPENLRPTFEMIDRNIKIEARLIDDLLDVTRITRNKLEFHRHPLDLHAVVRQAVEVCRVEIEAKGLDFSMRLEATAVVVEGDAGRLQQVFWNIIKNAVKFTPAGGRVEVRSRNEADGRIVVEIVDSGIGIAAEHLPRIFKPFEQGDAARSRQYGGLGLGLAISLATVEAHGGWLRAESDGEGRGSKFVVDLVVCASGGA